jgi:hypothetical protein
MPGPTSLERLGSAEWGESGDVAARGKRLQRGVTDI